MLTKYILVYIFLIIFQKNLDKSSLLKLKDHVLCCSKVLGFAGYGQHSEDAPEEHPASEGPGTVVPGRQGRINPVQSSGSSLWNGGLMVL